MSFFQKLELIWFIIKTPVEFEEECGPNTGCTRLSCKVCNKRRKSRGKKRVRTSKKVGSSDGSTPKQA